MLIMSLHVRRIVVGAPRGTYPGGLGLPDPGTQRENRTGLVYSCIIGTDQPCEGVRGMERVYLDSPAFTDGTQTFSRGQVDFFVPEISEGRLFDQAGE